MILIIATGLGRTFLGSKRRVNASIDDWNMRKRAFRQGRGQKAAFAGRRSPADSEEFRLPVFKVFPDVSAIMVEIDDLDIVSIFLKNRADAYQPAGDH